LGWFFDEWLTRGGMLDVRAGWSYERKAGTLRLDLEQRQPGPPFRMPIEVAIATPGSPEPRIERIELREPRQSFSIPVESEPSSVTLDPRELVLMDAEVARLDGHAR